MKVTGYKLTQAIKEMASVREIAESVFADSIWRFEDDEKPTPQDAMKALQDAETRFSRLQAAQARFNQEVQVEVQGTKMSLALAVKLVGGAGRLEKKWREVAKDTGKNDLYGESRSRRREEGIENAVKTIKTAEAHKLAKEAARYAAALREAIWTGNAKEIEFTDLEPELFE